MADPLQGKVALVTNAFEYGGPGPIKALLEEGMTVAVHDRRFGDAAERDAYEKAHQGTIAFAEQEPGALADKVLERCGTVYALVSNDVVHPLAKTLDQSTGEEFRTHFEQGMFWPFELVRKLSPGMKAANEGAMVFVTSGAAIRSTGPIAMYAAVRAGATAMMRTIAKEMAPYNVQVNAIGPNWFKSDTYFPDELTNDPAFQERVKKSVPTGRLGTQEEMGALVRFLVSRQAMPITGTFIPFAGGYYA